MCDAKKSVGTFRYAVQVPCLGVLGLLWCSRQAVCLAKLTGCFPYPPLPCANIFCLPALTLLFASAGESSQELGPPPSVDEAANTLMTRLGFLLGDKVSEGPAGTQYSMEEPEARQVMAPSCFFLLSCLFLQFKSYPNEYGHFWVLVNVFWLQ